jgi:hypothetical protein
MKIKLKTAGASKGGGLLLKNSGALNFRFQHSALMTSQRNSPPQAFLMSTFTVYCGWEFLEKWLNGIVVYLKKFIILRLKRL